MKKPFFLLGYKDNKYSLTDVRSLVFIVIGMLLGIVLLVGWPFLGIWSLNTLFNLSIEYSLKTWLASAIIIFTLGASVKRKSNE